MLEAPRAATTSPSLRHQKSVLWLAFIIIVSVTLLAFLSIQRLIAASVRVENSQAELIEINRFLSDLKDVETAAGAMSSARISGICSDKRTESPPPLRPPNGCAHCPPAIRRCDRR